MRHPDQTFPKDVEPDDFAKRLTAHFAETAAKAIDDLHARGLPAHGDADGVWAEIPPPEPEGDPFT